MIHLKTEKELEIMKKSGKILSDVMDTVLSQVKPGVSLKFLDDLAFSEIKKYGGKPSFHTVGGYKWTICACVNDVVVHGIPTDYVIAQNDVVGIDCGVLFEGFHSDSAWTLRAGDRKDATAKEIDTFLETGEKALEAGLSQVKKGNRIGDISAAVQKIIEGKGYSIVKNLIGHGVGKELHEDPEVPGFLRGNRAQTPLLEPGLTIAVEVIYNLGNDEVVYKGNDGWTIATKDGTISGLFEATVALGDHGSFLLTKTWGPHRKGWGK
jgi:methionyl aminopeptidase